MSLFSNRAKRLPFSGQPGSKPQRKSSCDLSVKSAAMFEPLEKREMFSNTGMVLPNALTNTAIKPALINAQPTVISPAVPQLSSRPGAKVKLFIDFNGGTYPPNPWGPASSHFDAFSIDSDVSHFSDVELKDIREIWTRVAEMYSAFNVDVTTLDPIAHAAGVVATALVTQGGPKAPAGQTAGIGGFGSSLYNNSIVFSNRTGPNGIGESNSYAAQAIAHEVGHQLGLYHQADFSGSKMVGDGYTHGNSAVGATMGFGTAYSDRGLWAVGTADLGGNTAPRIQNDVKIIDANPNFNGYANDWIGHNLASATPIYSPSGAIVSSYDKGTIVPLSVSNPSPLGAQNYTSDWWSFNSLGGQIDLKANSGRSSLVSGIADPGATLHVNMTILNSSGAVVAYKAASSLDQSFSGTLPAGKYYVKIAPAADAVDNNPAFTNRSFFDMGDYFFSGKISVPAAFTAEYNATAHETDAYGTSVQALLGSATSDVTLVPGNSGAIVQSFHDNGAIYWSPQTGAHVIYGGIGYAYAQSAHLTDAYGTSVQKILGLPTSDESAFSAVPNSRVSQFQGGAIYWSASTGAHPVIGGIAYEYAQTAHETDAYGTNIQKLLGLPTTDEMNYAPVAGSRVQYFSGGMILWSPSTGAHALIGGIVGKYRQLAAQTTAFGQPLLPRFGLPVSDEVAAPGTTNGRVVYFQAGAIYWSPNGGAHAVYGGILYAYNKIGGSSSWLGLPISDESGVTNRIQYFEHGHIFWTPNDGTQVIPNGVFTL